MPEAVSLWDAFNAIRMGITELYDITREEQGERVAASRRKPGLAIGHRVSDDDFAPVKVADRGNGTQSNGSAMTISRIRS